MNLSRVLINKSNLLDNILLFKGIIDDSLLAPVIKANAYGHGVEEIIPILQEAQVSIVAVNYLQEALEIRERCPTIRIIVVGPHGMQVDWHMAFKHKIELTLSHPELFTDWFQQKEKCLIHIKLNTGLNRQGFTLEQIQTYGAEIVAHQKCIAGFSSHFANVEDVLNQQYANKQLEEFSRFKKYIVDNLKITHKEFHIAASGAALIIPESRMDISRVGIAIYGIWPSEMTKLSYANLFTVTPELKPVMQWQTEIAEIRHIKAGDFVGYGCAFRAQVDMKIAVVPVGYDEGYCRMSSDRKAFVLIQGSRCAVVGRICMNMMMVDISHLTKVQLGETITLMGQDGEESIDIHMLASWSDTIAYEALTRIHKNIPRIVIEN